MNRRTRKRSTAYLRYLKPGALAQLRDSKINARTHHRSPDSQIYLPPSSPVASSPSRSPNPPVSGQQHEAVGIVDRGSPCFLMGLYGPRCPQRKKLMAARSVLFLNPNPTSSMSDGPDRVIDALANDFVAAH